MTISVCMIVKNEESVLGRCLDCVCAFADEIIVVDTGSSDKTVDIAAEYTDKVYYSKWNDDFSEARNISLSYGTSDYLMWLDADDVITPENAKRLNALKKRGMTADVYMLPYALSFDEDGKADFVFYRERILKRSKNFRFEGFVHESVTPSERIEYEDITVEHRSVGAKNPLRNLNLYRKKFKDGYEPKPRERYYYGRELFYCGFLKKATSVLTAFLKKGGGTLFDEVGACCVLSECLTLSGEKEKAADALLYALKNGGGNAEVCCRLGALCLGKSDTEDAIFWYKCALCAGEKMKSGVFVQRRYSLLVPALQLTCLYYASGAIAEAKKYHLLAKLDSPNNPSVLYNNRFFE